MRKLTDATRAHPAGETVFWTCAVSLLPFVYLLTLTLPRPCGLGLHVANDFTAHRIWYTQTDTYFLSKGYFPLWNPTFEMGAPHLAVPFGTASHYPLRWWTYVLTYFGGMANYIVQYVQIGAHMSLAVCGLFAILRRHGHLCNAAAALGAAMLLLNQCFNNFIRFPHGIENLCWVPWILYFGLELASRCGALREHGRRAASRNFLALALCVTLSWLTGYGQFSYVGGLLVGLVIAVSARSIIGLGLAIGAGLLGSVVAIGAIWPAIEWVAQHPLRSGVDMAGINVVGVTDYAHILLRPFAVDIHYSMFTFPVLFCLSAGGVLLAWKRPNVRVSLGMLTALLLLLDNARGVDGLSFKCLYGRLPFFGAFNSPSKNIWLAFIPLGWFAGISVDAILRHRQALKLILPLIALGSAALALCYSAASPATGVGIWQPLATGWIEPDESKRAYQWLVYGSGLAVCCYLAAGRKSPVAADPRVGRGGQRLFSPILRPTRGSAATFPAIQAYFCGGLLAAMCCLFVVQYAQFNTFVSKDCDPQALIGAADAYPEGLLARRTPAGYLGLTGIGVTSPTVNPAMYELIMGEDRDLIGDQHTRFPASRFLWKPDSVSDELKLRLTSCGPNHMYFDVEAGGAGALVYLAKHSPHWVCNHPYERAPGYNEFYKFNVPPGRSTFRLQFLPVSHIVTGLVTIVGVFGMAGALAWLCNKRRPALVCLCLSLVIAAAFLAGSFTRHSMSDRDLYGINNVSLDPAMTLSGQPDRSPRPRRSGRGRG